MLEVILSKLKRNEAGSASIEFIGILPLVFMLMLILWQFLISAYAVILGQSAVNEAAKVYAITSDAVQAEAAASKILNTAGSSISFAGSSISGTNEFNATVNVKIDFVFLPDKWFNPKPSYTFPSEASGKVIR